MKKSGLVSSAFQYSLCRVVLMVLIGVAVARWRAVGFSTRSVESF